MTNEPSLTGQNPSPSGASPDERNSRKVGRARAALGHVPTVLAFVVIGAVAYWGHHTGWKAPKFLAVPTAVDDKEDWCEEHGVPDSKCIKCHPELVGASTKDWCPEHGVPESKCAICHPEILKTGVAGDWCPEHGVPESGCTICHPEIAVKGNGVASETTAKVILDPSAAAQPATAPARAGGRSDLDPGHADNTEGTETVSDAAHAHDKDPKTCQTHNLRVQFASADSVRKVGVGLGQVVERAMSANLAANAEADYDGRKYAQLSSPVPARVWRVEKEVGQPVKEGDVLALLDAAEVGKAKSELLAAVAEQELKDRTVRRLRSSAESGFKTDAELEEGEAAVRSANIRFFNAQQALINLGLSNHLEDVPDAERRNIQFMGLPKAISDTLDAKTTTASLLPVIAPFDGVVIERRAVVGEMVESSKPLFAVADTRQMWVNANVPLSDALRVKIGQKVTFRPDGAPDQAATGKVSWISTAVDDRTRTLMVRASVENHNAQLLAHTFGKALITIREKPSAIAVPDEAVQWEGCCNIVFVRLTAEIFQTRKVKLGTKVNGFTEITAGVLPGEVIATAGSHVLKSEILKSALGAGCADGH
jgi:cobalt-zinc-cadmium efflux system membrane fusion protein